MFQGGVGTFVPSAIKVPKQVLAFIKFLPLCVPHEGL